MEGGEMLLFQMSNSTSLLGMCWEGGRGNNPMAQCASVGRLECGKAARPTTAMSPTPYQPQSQRGSNS